MSPGAPATRETRVIFSCGEKEFTARDVLGWALLRGELKPLWREFVHARQCEHRAVEDGLEVDDSAVDAAVVAFRYEQDLITAEEAERWLEDRGLTLDDLGEHFARQYWARTYANEVTLLEQEYSSATAEEKDLFLVYLTLTGELDRQAEGLSFRVAVQAEENTAADCDDATRVTAMEQSFQRRIASVVTEKALERELMAMRLNLTRFELEMIEVDSRDAAAEVIACVRSDGMEMSDVAEESRYPFRRAELLLEDLPAEQQRNFLSVKSGAVLEPIPREDGFEVCRVKAREDPQLSDPRIRERLEERISARHFSELVSKHIDWKLLQPAAAE